MSDRSTPSRRTADANRAMLERAIAVISDDGPAAMSPFLADDVEWYEIGRAEPIRGREALLAHLTRELDWHIVPFVDDLIADDDHVVVLIRSHASRGRHTLNYRVAEIYDIRDGLVARRRAFSDDTAAIAAFFEE